MDTAATLTRVRQIYDNLAPSYDRSHALVERLVMGDGMRRGLAVELRGDVLEVAIGTGRNLPFYPAGVGRVVGIDLSRGMLAQARRKARELDRPVALAQMDAQRLAFAAASFDTVTVSLALCTVPDPERTLRELARVCRPDGHLVLLEHVRSPVPPLAWLQGLLTPLQVRALGCHLDRTTVETLRRLGFVIETERSRFFGVFRLVVARPPGEREAIIGA